MTTWPILSVVTFLPLVGVAGFITWFMFGVGG